MIGQTVSHYKILEELGTGGMGVVYKAEDTKLKRTVALKFLPPELTRDKAAKTRFIHEAQTASALQHHNICTIHEIDVTKDGRLFISMDCYEGETLKEKIARGPLPLLEAIDVASQVAAGLSEAHEAEMIHRDIKPANIMVTDKGVVKILDFGLAKLVGQTKMTKTGTTVGTVAYMSPEQATGNDIDHRSDVFSLGAVLYEMLAGELPFKGDHEAAVLYGITHNDPTPLAKYRTDVPEDLQRIVDTTLRKEPGERYQNASEVMEDLSRFRKGVLTTGYAGGTPRKTWLRTLTIAAVSMLAVIAGYLAYSHFLSPEPEGADASRKMIAVLPFDNLGLTEDDYFADGITDAITARLAVVHGLGVISRQSAIQYKETKKSLREIGVELGVEFILEGTVQRERPADPASRIRVIPQLIRVSDDTHLWAETYDDEMSEVFEVQSEIAGNVAEALDVMLLASERQAIKIKPTDNLEAYDYYLAGKDHDSRNLNITDAQTAVEKYSKAVEIDPKFSAAWASLARVQAFLHCYYSTIDALPNAVESANNALELAPESVETQMALGYVQYYGYQDYDKAFDHIANVLKGQPNNTDALNMKGSIHRRRGEWLDAVADLSQMMELDPRDYSGALNLARCHIFMRNFDKAEHALNRAISINPTASSLCYEFKALVNVMKDGSVDIGEQTIREALKIVSKGGWESTDWIARLILVRTMPEVYKQVLVEARYEGPTMSRAVGLLLRTELDLQTGRTASARMRCDSIQTLIEPLIKIDPDDAPTHCMLGLTYSNMGMKGKAIEEGKTMIEQLPVSRDAVTGAALLGCLAEIYVRVGEYENALDEIEYLATIPSLICVGLLNCDPIWAPLRDHPRFEQILEKLSRMES